MLWLIVAASSMKFRFNKVSKHGLCHKQYAGTCYYLCKLCNFNEASSEALASRISTESSIKWRLFLTLCLEGNGLVPIMCLSPVLLAKASAHCIPDRTFIKRLLTKIKQLWYLIAMRWMVEINSSKHSKWGLGFFPQKKTISLKLANTANNAHLIKTSFTKLPKNFSQENGHRIAA